MNEVNNFNNSKKRHAFISAIAVILAVIIFGSSTFAYLQGTTNDVINNFKTNQVMVDLKETTGSDYDIIPGTSQGKDPTVTANTTIPAYVYIEVTDNTDGLVEYEITNDWKTLNGYENIYYREIDGDPNEQSFNILKDNKVFYSDTLVNGDMLVDNGDGTFSLKEGITLSFKALAIQQNGFKDEIEAYKNLTTGDIYPSWSETSEVAFFNGGQQGDKGRNYWTDATEQLYYNKSVKNKNYFLLPIKSGETLQFQNDSEEQIYSVYILTSDLTVIETVGSAVGSYVLPNNATYISLYVKNKDSSKNLSPADVDLEHFKISYTDDNYNILNELRIIAYDYLNTELKNFDANAIRELDKNSKWCAHAGGTQVAADKNTERVILAAIDNGADIIEIDVRRTSDGVLICEHDDVITGSSVAISESTYAECLAAKNDLLKFEEVIEIIKTHSDTLKIYPDMKDGGNEAYKALYSIIDSNNFVDRISHSKITGEHYGIDLSQRRPRTLCLNVHSVSGLYKHYVSFANDVINGNVNGVSMWETQTDYSGNIHKKRTEYALYILTAFGGKDVDYLRNLYSNVHIPITEDDTVLEQEIIDMMPHDFWIATNCLDIA